MPKMLYPTTEARKQQYLKIDDTHELYVAQYGDPLGIPVVVLHGGPGSCIEEPFHSQFFDPQKYHIILFDQRGCGKSRPKGELKDNDTRHLIADLETIRKFLNIQKWVVFGGSWGSTLGLLYAEAHPDRVSGLILRGIFLGREQDTDAFLREGCRAAQTYPEQWQSFKDQTAKLVIQANIALDYDSIIDTFYDLLTQPNVEIQKESARLFSWWEKVNSKLKVDLEQVDLDAATENGRNMGLVETTYMKHKWFIQENEILDNIHKIAHIPTYIVNGRYDLLCSPEQAYTLASHLKDIKLTFPLAGHSAKDEANISALVEAADTLAARLTVDKNNIKTSSVQQGFLRSIGDKKEEALNAAPTKRTKNTFQP